MSKTNDKASELKAAVAKETGVPLEQVDKILSHLGLDKSLARRLEVGDIEDVDVTRLRIATNAAAE